MHLSRRIRIQLAVFGVVALIAGSFMVFGYMNLPKMLFGVGHYRVTVELPEAAGLYASGNVTYRGTEVGRVEDVYLTDTGVNAVLSLESNMPIPSDLRAEVHSQTAVGEQYVALLPQSADSPSLRDGDVIPVSRSSVPPDINVLLDATTRGLQAIPQDNLRTTVDEAYIAIAGLGPEISRFVKGSTALAADARANLDSLTALIDRSQPVLDSQGDTSDSIQAWAAHVASVTGQLEDQDAAFGGVLDRGGPAAGEVRDLFERLRPTLPILLANLSSVAPVAVTYRAGLEQLLVLIPSATAAMAGSVVPNHNGKQDYNGMYLSFNLNLNLPPPCTTGYLPASQARTPNFEDAPERPAGDLYCRIPQDSMFNVRGARNIPCVTVPGKRAPTVKMCESNEQYVPLNEGFNWKGDPNATLSGQDIPQFPPGTQPQGPAAPAPASAPAPPPEIAAAQYDPATGEYVGPDGKVYTQADLAEGASGNRTWQDMLTPPAGG